MPPTTRRAPAQRATARTPRVARSIPSPSYEVERFTLPNGLRVVLAPGPQPPVVGDRRPLRRRLPLRAGGPHRLRAPVRAPDVPGLGEPRRSWSTSGYVQASGGIFNGSTHLDYTNYYEVLPSHALERAPVPRGRPDARAADHRGEPGQPDRRGQGRDPGQRAQPALRRLPVDRCCRRCCTTLSPTRTTVTAASRTSKRHRRRTPPTSSTPTTPRPTRCSSWPATSTPTPRCAMVERHFGDDRGAQEPRCVPTSPSRR